MRVDDLHVICPQSGHSFPTYRVLPQRGRPAAPADAVVGDASLSWADRKRKVVALPDAAAAASAPAQVQEQRQRRHEPAARLEHFYSLAEQTKKDAPPPKDRQALARWLRTP